MFKLFPPYFLLSAELICLKCNHPGVALTFATHCYAQADDDDEFGDPDKNRPRGCLAVHGALASSDEASPIQKDLVAFRMEAFVLLRKRFVKARSKGDLPANSDPTALAQYLLALSYGMAVLAVNGANRAELHRMVKVAMTAWPTRS